MQLINRQLAFYHASVDEALLGGDSAKAQCGRRIRSRFIHLRSGIRDIGTEA